MSLAYQSIILFTFLLSSCYLQYIDPLNPLNLKVLWDNRPSIFGMYPITDGIGNIGPSLSYASGKIARGGQESVFGKVPDDPWTRFLVEVGKKKR